MRAAVDVTFPRRAMATSPSSENGEGPVRPPYRHKPIDTYFPVKDENDDDGGTVRGNALLWNSPDDSGVRGGLGGARGPHVVVVLSDDEEDGDYTCDRDSGGGCDDGDDDDDEGSGDGEEECTGEGGETGCGESDGWGDDDDEWEDGNEGSDDDGDDDCAMGEHPVDNAEDGERVYATPRRLGNSLFSAGAGGIGNGADVDASAALSMAAILRMTPLTTVASLASMTDGLSGPFTEPVGRIAQRAMWMVQEDAEEVIRRLGMLSFNERMEKPRSEARSALARGTSPRVRARPREEAEKECSAMEIDTEVDTSLEMDTEPRYEDEADAPGHVSTRLSHPGAAESFRAPFAASAPGPASSGLDQSHSRTRSRQRKHRDHKSFDIDKHTAAQIAAAVRKGREEGRQEELDRATDLEQSLLTSRHGRIVDLARATPGVSQTILDRLEGCEDTVYVPVHNMNDVRGARAELACMQRDQFLPDGDCNFCKYLPARNAINSASRKRSAFAKIIYDIADTATGTLGDYTAPAKRIVAAWNEFVGGNTSLTAEDRKMLHETISSAKYHFFKPDGCLGLLSVVCAHSLRGLIDVGENMRSELYVQRVVNGRAVGGPIPDPDIHRRLLENSKVVHSYVKLLPAIKAAESCNTSYAPSSNAAVRKAAAASLSRGMSSLRQ